MQNVLVPLIVVLTLFVTPLLTNVLHAGNAADESIASSQRLDINAASAEELARKLPGIGPVKAASIVQWRLENGLFGHIEQLQEVKGIGPRTVEKLRDLVRVGSEEQAKLIQDRQDRREAGVRSDINSIFDTARVAALPEAVRQVPVRTWFQKSMLEILRTH